MGLKIEREEYPASKCTIHISLILEYMLTRGSITHEECEAFTAERGHKCTVVRSRMPEIRLSLFWPVITKMEKHPGGSHARYFLDYDTLGDLREFRASKEVIQAAAKEWRELGRIFYSKASFLDWLGSKLHEEKIKDLRTRHAIFRAQVKANPSQMVFPCLAI